jgi:hypothetical protein
LLALSAGGGRAEGTVSILMILVLIRLGGD